MSSGDPVDICPLCGHTFYVVNGHSCAYNYNIILPIRKFEFIGINDIKKNDKTGLYLEDQKLSDMICALWNYWSSIENKHNSDNTDFLNAIHQLQRIVTSRSFRKQHLGYWRE